MISIKENIKNVEEFNLLYDAVGWGAYDEKITQKALNNTFYSVSVYDDKEIFKPYEKKHSTVKYVCENLNGLNIKNLILYHTEDTHPNDKDILYKEEAKQSFDNIVIVPKDLDVIEIK